MPPVVAHPAELLRSSQKDDVICEELQRKVSSLLLSVLGPRRWIRLEKWIAPTTRFGYLMATTFSNLQTLGEEYCGLLLVDSSLQSLPSRKKRLLMIILDCFGPWIFQLMIKVINEKAEQSHWSFKNRLAPLLESSRLLELILDGWTKGIFYISGVYLHLPKLMTGLRYMSFHENDPEVKSQLTKTFQLTGILTIIHLALRLKQELKVIKNQQKFEAPEVTQFSGKSLCPLCLDVRINSAATFCGHVFCWECIMKNLEINPDCPICREPISRSRIIPMLNY